MPGNEKDRDWDREMKEVDKLLAKLPDADPTLGPPSAVGQTPPSASAKPPGGSCPKIASTPRASWPEKKSSSAIERAPIAR